MIIRANTLYIPLRDESVHCVITSPPYWGLRDYGVSGQLGLERTPEEYVQNMVKVFREVWRVLRDDGTCWINIGDSYASGKGTCFNPGGGSSSLGKERKESGAQPLDRGNKSTLEASGLKPKDLCGIPWRLAFALQADGWYLRSDIIWAKPNPMPESVSGCAWERHRVKIKRGKTIPSTLKKPNYSGDAGLGRTDILACAEWADCPGCSKCTPNDGYVLSWNAGRPTKAHEYIFLLTKSPKYFFDQEAVKESDKGTDHWRAVTDGQKSLEPSGGLKGPHRGIRTIHGRNGTGRNIRTVWNIPTQGFSGAHFACVDAETECLTAEGWKNYSEIKIGETGAQFDLKTEKLSWAKIQDLSIYEVSGQEMIRSGSRDADMLLTPNHRCVIHRRHRFTRKHLPADIVRADELRPSHSFPTSAVWEAQDFFVADPGKKWAELCGWYIAEGHECKNSLAIEIYQSMTANPQYVETIRNLLKQVEAEFKEATGNRKYKGEERKQTVFRVLGYTAARFREICPEKQFPQNYLLWGKDSCLALLKGLIEGDGSIRDGGDRRCFVQKGKKTADDVQALAIRCGFSSNLTGRGDGIWTVYLTKHKTRSFRGTNGKGTPIEKVKYSGVVWCPRLPLGTWVARRNGRVFITGNTFPEELVRRCLLAGTSEKGCCPKCGGPWVRVIESKPATSKECPKTVEAHYARGGVGNPVGTVGKSGSGRIEGYTKTLAWRPSCECGEERTVPAIVLDPFFGAGTVGVVARKYNRRFVGLELKSEYIEMAQKRVNSQPVAML